MRLVFADAAWEDYCHWQTHDAALFARINDLIGAIQRDPRSGIGEPEALRHTLEGFCSRRISSEQRVVYRVEDDVLMITADHGCDPASPSTDHSREYVPLLIWGHPVPPGLAKGTRTTFADAGATAAALLGVESRTDGEPLL
jgi:Txe/YoeB family toxin of toxin-antitoxin system